MRGHILGIGVHVLCSDGKIRELLMNPRLAGKILEFVKHKQGGRIILGPHVLKISYEPVAVSKAKEVDYIPLARQLVARSVCILEVDSPCYPPDAHERRQCSCVMCLSQLRIATLQS